MRATALTSLSVGYYSAVEWLEVILIGISSSPTSRLDGLIEDPFRIESSRNRPMDALQPLMVFGSSIKQRSDFFS